jgi:glycerate 2-kinase
MGPLRIVIAPDSYKGSLSAVEAATAMERGIRKVFPDAEIRKIPIADGGEGTVDALAESTGGRIITEKAPDPLGRPISAQWGILGDGRTAVIETAAASGLNLVPQDRRDPRIASSRGTGQLIKAALDAGLPKIIIGLGGSAVNDGGAGMMTALGVVFLDERGDELPPGGAPLINLSEIDLSAIDPRLKDTEITVACDVDNPLCGTRGASAVYGPQKGATPEIVEQLDAALSRYAKIAQKTTGKDISRVPGAGAAGGLGAGLMFFTNAVLRPGIEIVIEAVGLGRFIREADLVITGEGNTDLQTAFGKAPAGVAAEAKKYGKPVICLSGALSEGANDLLGLGVDALLSIANGPMTLDESMSSSGRLVEEAAERLARLISVGMRLNPVKPAGGFLEGIDTDVRREADRP